ncbi:MAG: uroporphyrinogen decarboxylase family protein [Planctomycetota bacterium]
MDPRERMLAALVGREVDRVPLDLPGFQFRTRCEAERVADPLRREVALRVFDRTIFRHGVSSYVNRMFVTPPQRILRETTDLPDGKRETRSVIDTPKGELVGVSRWDPASRTGWTVKYPVEGRDDISKLASVPWELPPDLAPPEPSAFPEDLGSRGIVEARISSPMVCVAGAMPYEMFLELCLTDMALVEELTELCRVRVLDCVRVLLSAQGIDLVWMGGSEWLTPPMASPEVYERLVQEQERSVIDCVHARSGAAVQIHCHGRVAAALPRMIDRGADYTEPVEPPPDGDITMAEAKALAAGRLTLGGNVEVRVVANESEEAVEAATRAAFEGGRERFVLRPTEGPSPELSKREFRNWMRTVDVWEEMA